MKRLKVLMSAYACEPGKGSEPGVGWNVAREMAKYHDIWVLTRANNRKVIEAELAENPVPGLQFAYYDLPVRAKWWKRGGRGVQLYYYLWQIGAYFTARKLHHEVGFDLTHHVTFVKYWAPSFLSLLRIPFIWGPVGGGESAPKAFWADFSPKGRRYERLREIARWLAERDPFVRLTARSSRVAIATTKDTAERLRVLDTGTVQILSQVGLGSEEIALLRRCPESPHSGIRFVSIGNLLHLKGFHLGLRAFGKAELASAAYWIIGDGPERHHLEEMAHTLGITEHVTFWGKLSREEALAKLAQCQVLVHPTLHDSGGFVCLEAMGASKPVLCLDLGGPAVQVTDETGVKISAHSPKQVVREIAAAMRRLAEDEGLRQRMGEAGRRRVCEEFTWRGKAEILNGHYAQAVRGRE